MGRAESKAAFKQGQQISNENQGNARASFANTNAELGNYGKSLSDYMNFGDDTFGEGGEYARTQKAIANTAAGAGTNAIASDLTLHRMRTGENTGGYAPAVAEARRSATRDVTDRLAGADASRLALLTKIKESGLDASKFPASVQAQLFGTSTGGANSALGAETEAAKTPGFWDSLANSLVSGAAAVGAGFAGKK